MRIGLFTDNYFPSSVGVTYTVEIARKNLEALGHEVFVIAPRSRIIKPKIEDNVLWVPAIEGIFFEAQMTSFFFPPSEVRKIQGFNLDIVMIFTPGQVGLLGAYMAVKYKMPLVSQYSTDLKEYIEHYPASSILAVAFASLLPFALQLSFKEFRSMLLLLGRRGSKQLLRRQEWAVKTLTLLHDRCDTVIALSDKMEHELKKWNMETPIVTIPTGIDALATSPDATQTFRQQMGIQKDDVVLMYVGRLAREKNVELLLNAFNIVAQQHRAAKLVLVGDNRHGRYLRIQAKASPFSDRIIFAGQHDRAQLGPVYAAADIFVFPSVTDTQALVVNEAAQAGLPFVWVDEGVNPVLIDKQTGFKALNNPTSFAKAVLKLIQTPDKRQAFGKQSQKLAKKYSEYSQTKKLEKLFNKLVGSQS